MSINYYVPEPEGATCDICGGRINVRWWRGTNALCCASPECDAEHQRRYDDGYDIGFDGNPKPLSF